MPSIGIDDEIASLSAKQGGVITISQCYALGVSYQDVRARCDSGRWRRLCRGTYLVTSAIVPAEAPMRSALLALGGDAVVVLGSAARLWKIDGAPSGPDLHVSRPRPSPRAHRPGVRLHHFDTPAEHVSVVNGIAVTSPLRTVADLMCTLDRASAIAVADSALNRGLVGRHELRNLLLSRRGRRGRARAMEWLTLVDGRAESPLETRVRLDCVDHGIPPDDLQFPIIGPDNTTHGFADMVWKKRRVVGEADGVGPHSHPNALFRDRERQNRFVVAGWIVLRFTWRDVMRPGAVASMVRRALHAAA